MIIRLHNPLTALSRPKSSSADVKKASLTPEEKIKADRIVTALLLVLALAGAVVYQILYHV